MFDIVVSAVLEGAAKALVEESREAKPSVDLQPLLEGLNKLQQQGTQILDALSSPTRTAGDDYLRNATEAFAHEWYEEALRDVEKSIEVYPYRGKPYLLGGMAALALSDGQRATQLFAGGVKYSANRDGEAGAVCALIGANLADAVGAKDYGLRLLDQADAVTNRRCPAILVALNARRGGIDDSYLDPLMQLWWDEGAPLAWTPGIPSTAIAKPPYNAAGKKFSNHVINVATVISLLQGFEKTLTQCVAEVNTQLAININNDKVKAALRIVGPLRIGFWDTNLGQVCRRCVGLPLCPPVPESPSNEANKSPWRDALSPPLRHINFFSWTSKRVLTELRKVRIAPQTSFSADQNSVIGAAKPDLTTWIAPLEWIVIICNKAAVDQTESVLQRWEVLHRPNSGKPIVHVPLELPPVLLPAKRSPALLQPG